MKNLLITLVGWNAFSTASAIVNCVCNNQTVSATYSPVCASDGNTYHNAELVTCMNTCSNSGLTILHYGACATAATTTTSTAATASVYPTSAPNLYPGVMGTCYCPNRGVYSPVCGSDGRTYANVQLLDCYNRCRDRNLCVISQGYCPKNLCICTNSNYDSPVCGNDGKTYRNPKIVECLNVCQRKNIRIIKFQHC